MPYCDNCGYEVDEGATFCENCGQELEGKMKLYVKVYFTPNGPDPLKVAQEMEDIGFEPVIGEYDFARDFDDIQEYGKLVSQLQKTLRGRSLEGSGIYFRLNTLKSG
ncbi:MAG: zinc ribbon domain-containing protein [Candidatus Natronoplasma sp.]